MSLRTGSYITTIVKARHLLHIHLRHHHRAEWGNCDALDSCSAGAWFEFRSA
jgi:hypothetical protein